MLLSIREDFPQSGEKLDPGFLCQCRGDMAQLNKGTEQRSSLETEKDELRCHRLCLPHPCSENTSHGVKAKPNGELGSPWGPLLTEGL